MKKDIHPKNHRPVIFHDNTSGARFLIPSTVKTTEEDTWDDGKKYPLFHVEISSASHPFYTGKDSIVDTAGRVQKFKSRKEKASTKVVSKKEKKTIKRKKKELKEKKK